LSALANTFGGIVGPICFAALTLRTSFELFRLLNWNVGWLGSLQDLVHKNGDSSEGLGPVGPVRHQAPALHHIFCARVYRWQPILRRKVRDQFLIGVGQRVGDGTIDNPAVDLVYSWLTKVYNSKNSLFRGLATLRIFRAERTFTEGLLMAAEMTPVILRSIQQLTLTF